MLPTKKAQLFSHPFMIIFSLLVIALLLIFGYRTIQSLLARGEEVDALRFETQLTKAVQEIYNEPPGSNRAIRISVPNSVEALCFLNLQQELGVIPYEDVRAIASALQKVGNAQHNVFLAVAKKVKTPNPLTINHLQPATQVCIATTRGTLNAIIENKGKSVDILKA